jgi:hypothetical protein
MRDFQGRATNEQFYEAGARVELDSALARSCIAEGAAEAIPLAAREGQSTPAPPALPPPKARQGRK